MENIIVKMKFGSHLYGLDTPESDQDYKGIFMPTLEEILLNKIPKSINMNIKNSQGAKNTNKDIDIEHYSLHYFIKLACEGQTVALDMLHAPENMIIETSPIWEAIQKNRSKFYTKNLKAFVGYARGQAAKYGVKGSRLNAAKEIIEFLENSLKSTKHIKLADVWDQLPINEHCRMLGVNKSGIKQYSVCGKTLQSTTKIQYALDVLNTFHKNYGKRAEKAAKNEGIDWKAISHALRAAFQVKELLLDNNITYPLKKAIFLKKVKAGQYDYLKVVSPILESLMIYLEELTIDSDLPDKVNRKYWDDWIYHTIIEYYKHDEVFNDY